MTRCPTTSSSTPGPTATTSPAPSLIGTRGQGPGSRPMRLTLSWKFRLEALTLTRTCPGPGSPTGLSTATGAMPGPSITIAVWRSGMLMRHLPPRAAPATSVLLPHAEMAGARGAILGDRLVLLEHVAGQHRLVQLAGMHLCNTRS